MFLNYLFVHGPGFLGCWEGRTRPSICSALTSVDASVWKLLPGECDELIERKVHSMEILVAYSLAFVAACRFAGSLLPLVPACSAGAEARHRLVGAPRLYLNDRNGAPLAFPAL